MPFRYFWATLYNTTISLRTNLIESFTACCGARRLKANVSPPRMATICANKILGEERKDLEESERPSRFFHDYQIVVVCTVCLFKYKSRNATWVGGYADVVLSKQKRVNVFTL